MAQDPAREILVRGARAIAHDDPSASSLESLLEAIAAGLDVESAAIVVANGRWEDLAVVASVGLPDPAVAALTAAMRNANHPIARTLGDQRQTFDVAPTQPGGPALRSHLPLTVTRDGTTSVLGVLALAYEQPLDEAARQSLEAAADLAAVVLERQRPI